MTGWNEHGHAVKTGLAVDRYLGHGDLQDAENCGYAPVSVLAEMGVDTTFGDPQVQYRDGRIRLLDGTLLERGGTLNCVWAVTVLPAHTEADVDALAAVLHDARAAGVMHGHYTLARWVLNRWAVQREQAAHERGVAEGLKRAASAITWEVTCLRCADQLDGLYAARGAGYAEGVADGRRQATAFIANEIRAELVCCDVYDRMAPLRAEVDAARPGWGEAYRELGDGVDGHDICYWGEAAARIAEGRNDESQAAEQAEPTCTCPDIDVTTYGKPRGSETVKGYDPGCAVCPKPVREGEALGVTDEQRADLHKVFGDLRDRVKARRAEQAGDDRG